MEFASSSRPKRKRGRQVHCEYSTRLQLYKSHPVHTITLHEFEELALRRLKLLQEIDRARQQCAHDGIHKGDKKYMSKMEKIFKEHMPLTVVDDQGMQTRHVEERRKDHISHFILRLAYCRTEDMRRWFLSQETELLRCRFLSLTHEDQEEFFDAYRDDFNFQQEVIPLLENAEKENVDKEKVDKEKADKKKADKKKVDEQLVSEVYSFYQSNVVTEDGKPQVCTCYKVPFVMALDLVQSRQVVVKKGYVYVPTSKTDMIVSLVCNKFRARVSEELVKTLHHLAVVDDDERIAPLLKTLKHRYLGEDFTDAGTQLAGQIQLSQLDTLSRESFPPCMRHLHESLRREHHLKHFGRLQLGLFLKSIGLSLDQALAFWRSEFIKKMEPDKFDKQYAYNVRHSYGKEGKRANYTAYSCMKVILSNQPGQGDHHGCPFRHWDEAHVRQMLSSHGVAQKAADEVVKYVRGSHYQLACQKYYEIMHGLKEAPPFSLEHPTQYFLESRKLRGVKKEVELPVKQEDATANEFADISAQDLEGFDDDMDTN